MKKYQRHWSIVLMVSMALGANCLGVKAADTDPTDLPFIAKPYLQLGNHPHLEQEESLELSWITNGNQDSYDLFVKTSKSPQWIKQNPAQKNILSYSVPDKLYTWTNQISGLVPGEKFDYKLTNNGKEVFRGQAVARKNTLQPYRMVLFGDTGADTSSERKIVYQSCLKKPDATIILGDIVYSFGRLSEYLAKFFPIFSSTQSSEKLGGPLLQSTVTLPVIGNHDIAYGDNKSGVNLDKLRDALAFYQLWSAPLNGPLKRTSEHNIPKLLGSEENVSRYLLSTGTKFPTMSNYSFDYGNSHWLILDANPYMSWTNQQIRDWVRVDLELAKDKTWKFVCFHQPGFSIDKAHNSEQRMRLLSDIFQTSGVDIVFSGHAHNYQRSYPLIFNPLFKKTNPSTNADGTVSGDFIFDKVFNGKNNNHPKGVIYIVSGAGGAALYGAMENANYNDQTKFTDKFNAATHSLTCLDVNKNKLNLHQISEDGKTIDSFTIEKPSY